MANSRGRLKTRGGFLVDSVGRRYTVTLRHDNGTVNITTFASDIIKAIELVCNADRAPIWSVIAVKVAK